MKTKWLWLAWSHLALAAVIALEIGFIAFATVFLVPKYRQMEQQGWIAVAGMQEFISWTHSFYAFMNVMTSNILWLALLAAVLWGLFEWRVRHEHKTYIRLSVMGTTALSLMLIVTMTAAALVIPLMVTFPQVVLKRA